MALTEVGTEKVKGRIKEVIIGYDGTHGVKIIKGTLSFEYWRNHDAKRADNLNTKTTANLFQPSSSFGWRLRFLSDCRQAFFATDVQSVAGSQYALVDNGDSNEIEYFKVAMTIEDEGGMPKTRTYTITSGYALKNRARIGDDELAVYEYEGDAEYISYSDA